MKNLALLLICFTLNGLVIGQSSNGGEEVVAKTSLTGLKKGRLSVLVFPPENQMDTLIYAMPKIIPGTYSISDFGLLLSDFKALSSKGKELPVQQLDENRWSISNAGDLDHLE